MEGSKTKYILVALVVIVIVAASVGLYLIKDAGVEGITALEGREIADKIALNWSSNYTLVYVHPVGNDVGGGHNTEWGYTYWDGTDIESNALGVQIDDNWNIKKEFTHRYPHEYPINNWTIDSDTAYHIAKDNEEISQFFSNHNPTLDGFFLGASTDQPIWNIDWAYDAFIDDPHWVKIQIDANTGEVLYVEADN